MLVKYIFDSLVVSLYFVGECFIDVGFGFGLFGILFVIMYLDKEFVLIDSFGKWICFLK